MKTVITTIILISVAFCSKAQFGGGVGSGYATGGTNTNVPLPVYSVELSANKTLGIHELSWNIISSSTVLNIDLEYSADQSVWTSIYTERGSNIFSNSYKNDKTTKTNYYRLKVTDLDESINYSKTILLLEKEIAGISMYPNPVINSLNINYPSTPYQLSIYNNQGQVIFNKEISKEQGSISTTNWIPGTYYISINNQPSKSIIKQ